MGTDGNINTSQAGEIKTQLLQRKHIDFISALHAALKRSNLSSFPPSEQSKGLQENVFQYNIQSNNYTLFLKIC